jgi:membrane fusion protein (multidrug efflux system)
VSVLRFVSAATAMLASLLSACGEAPQDATGIGANTGSVLVETVAAAMQSVPIVVEAVGTLNGNESVTLTAKLTEQVSAVHFEGGELVSKGQILVELVAEEQLALLNEAQARLEETRLQLQRLVSLGADIATSAEIDVARTRVQANEALLEALRSRISDRTIRAPFDGVIGFRRISVGALLAPGTVIAELDDIDPLKLDFTLPELYLSRIEVGDAVDAASVAWDGEQFSGAVARIGRRVDPVTRAFPVQALISNADARLRPGMLMTVKVSLGETSRIVIPESALMQVGAQSAVYVVDSDSIARRVAVQIGRRLPGAIVILGGVKPGDRVVSNGQLTLSPGARVIEAESDATQPMTSA